MATPSQEQIDKGLQIVSNNNPELGDQIADALGYSNSPNQPITSVDLTQQKSFDIVDLPPETSTAGLLGEIESSTDTFTKDLETKSRQAEQGEKDSFQQLVDNALKTPGETELTAQAEKTAGVDKLDVELKGINDQIRQEQNALRRRIERVQTTAGLTKGQVDNEVSEINRVSARKQADLYVIQQGVQGRYDSAKAIADRAVAVQMEQGQRKLQILQLNYERNKDLFTKSEQRLFETKQADRERKLAKEEKNLQDISDFSIDALQNGAPASIVAQMRQAKTVDEALSIGAKYVGLKERLATQLLGIQISTAADAAAATKKAVEAGYLSKDQADLADSLRKEYNGLQEVKNSKDLEANTTSLLIALEQEDGVSDISAINTFQRLVVDPGVAVREGDVSLLQSAMSFTDKSTLRAKGLMVGDKLTPTARAQMKQLALGVYDARKAIVESQTSPIKTRAQESSIDFNKYIGNEFSSSDTIKERVSKIDPATAVLDSYDQDVYSPDNLFKESQVFFGSLKIQ